MPVSDSCVPVCCHPAGKCDAAVILVFTGLAPRRWGRRPLSPPRSPKTDILPDTGVPWFRWRTHRWAGPLSVGGLRLAATVTEPTERCVMVNRDREELSYDEVHTGGQARASG